MKQRNLVALSFLAYASLLLALFFFRLGGEKNYIPFVNTATYITPVLAIVFCALALNYFGFASRQGKSLFFMLIGIALWWIADIYWGQVESAVYSFADIFYFAGYGFIGTGILASFSLHGLFENKKKLAIFAVLSAVFIAAYIVFVPFSWDSGISFVENMITNGYVVADLFLALCTGYLVLNAFYGAVGAGWIFVGISFIMDIIADAYYAMLGENYAVGGLIDVIWLLAYILFAYGIYIMMDKTKSLLETSAFSRKRAKN